jgi:hypothetical protein
MSVDAYDKVACDNIYHRLLHYPRSQGTKNHLEVARRSRMDLSIETIVSIPSEVHSLMAVMCFQDARGVYDFWSGTGTISQVLREYDVPVRNFDINPGSPARQADALDLQTYTSQQASKNGSLNAVGINVIILSPDFRFVDLAVVLAVRAVNQVACIHVPANYIASGHQARINYFNDLRAQGRLLQIQCLPKGPTGFSNQWIVVFQNGIDKRHLLHTGEPIMYSDRRLEDGTLHHRALVTHDLSFDDIEKIKDKADDGTLYPPDLTYRSLRFDSQHIDRAL